ncbi:MAG: adenine phosphoribosyltransferase [Candidatus Acidiferrales bacterium]
MDDLKKLIREISDYPKPGILFYDVTTLLKDSRGFHLLVDSLCEHYNGKKVDIVVGIEARGFIFAPALAYRLGAGFVPVRKPKKLPWKIASVTYQLEYGTDQLEIHEDAVRPGQRVIICDDLLATGGTASAAVQLVRQLGGEVAGAAFAVELNFLHGRAKLRDVDVFSLIRYDIPDKPTLKG